MVSSDSAAWALQAPSRRRTAGSRRGSAGRRSASGAGIRRARSRTGAAPAPVPASSAAARSSGARAWCRAARAARSSPAAGEPEHHRGARLEGLLGLPEPLVGPAEPPARHRRPGAARRPGRRPAARADRRPDQSSVPAAPSSTAHCAAPSTGGPGRPETHSVQRLEGPDRRAFSAEGLGHQAPELRHRNRGGARRRRRPGRRGRRPAGSRRSRPGATPRPCRADATVARATRPHRGSGNRPFALAGGTSLITPLPSLPPSSLDNGSRHRPPGGRPRRRPRGPSVLRESRGTTTLRYRPGPVGGTDIRSRDVSDLPRAGTFAPTGPGGGSVRILA